MGAMQAQDYLMSLWAIGLRTAGCTEHDVETAIADGTIVRTWTMRRTIHFAAAEDVHWMMGLTSERIIKAYGAHMPQLGLDADMIKKARAIVTRALEGGKCLTRDAIYALFAEAGIPTDRSRGIHILWRLGQEAIICFGPRDGKQQTFTLLDEWVPVKEELSREEAIGEATRRYFTSHGPATAQDFAWWSGLTMKDVRAGIASVDLREEQIDGATYYLGEGQVTADRDGVYLLPSFDEYLISYKDRTAAIDPQHLGKVNRGLNGMFRPIIVVDGTIEGTWRREIKKGTVRLSTDPFGTLANRHMPGVRSAAHRYGSFLALQATVT
jgi:hypothetical protein